MNHLTEQGISESGIIYSSLKQLKDGDVFSFKDGQNVIYGVGHNQPQKMETRETMQFVVVKKNKKTVKCTHVSGRIEYSFKFEGVFSDYTKGNNCMVYIRDTNYLDEVWSEFLSQKAKQYESIIQQ